MPGLVPGIHAAGPPAGLATRIRAPVQYFAALLRPNRVDNRDKPAHDGQGSGAPPRTANLAPRGRRRPLQAAPSGIWPRLGAALVNPFRKGKQKLSGRRARFTVALRAALATFSSTGPSRFQTSPRLTPSRRPTGPGPPHLLGSVGLAGSARFRSGLLRAVSGRPPLRAATRRPSARLPGVAALGVSSNRMK